MSKHMGDQYSSISMSFVLMISNIGFNMKYYTGKFGTSITTFSRKIGDKMYRIELNFNVNVYTLRTIINGTIV